MNVLEAIRGRRSIRKYQNRQIPREDLEKILEAGSFAPNAGGGQRAILVGVHNRELTSRLGRQNLAKFDRSRLAGNFVSKEQPSTIDDPTIQTGFTARLRSALSLARRTSSTACRTPFAARRTWSWPPMSWGFPPASSPGRRRPSKAPWAPISWRNGASPGTTRPGALWLWAMWKGTTRRKSPGKTAG